MSLWKETCRHNHGFIALTEPAAITLVTPGQYYKVPGVYAVFDHANFIADANGKLTHLDAKGAYALNGTSDTQVNKACKITYGLYKNGSILPGAESPHTFAASSKIDTLSIASILHIIKNDYLEVYAKSDIANTLLTPSTLHVTLFGARY